MSKGKFCLIVSSLLYGMTPVLAAFAYRGGINGITLTFLRSFVSIPLLYIIIKWDKRPLKLTRTQLKKVILLGVFGGALPVLLLYLSYNYISTGLATTLHFVYPLIIVLATAILYHEPIPRVTLSAVVFVTVGIFMFTDISEMSDKTGIILALISGVLYSFYVIYMDRSGLDKLDYIVLTFYVMIIISISTFLYGIFIGRLRFDITGVSWSLAVIISLLATLGAMPLFQIGVLYEGASTAGILSTVEPVTSVILGALLLNETINTGQIMGGAMILFGVIIAQRKSLSVKKRV